MIKSSGGSMSTVIILGAGASRAAGAPLMYDFIDKATKIYRERDTRWALAHFERVVAARRQLQLAYAKSNIDLDNIENLFSTFEMASLIGSVSNLSPNEVNKLPVSLRYVIMRTLESSIQYSVTNDSEYVNAPYPYNAFAELIVEMSSGKNAEPVTVINFNYDLCLDYALTLLDAKFDYGLNGKPKENLRLFKVHGSLNWFKDEKLGDITYNSLTKFPKDRFINRYGINDPESKSIDTMEIIFGPSVWGDKITPDPLIVPPTWNKGWYHQQLQSVWQNASTALHSAENIYVIGYSLPDSDQFFRSFYSISTLSDTIIENFMIFDPCRSQSIIDRFKSLLGPAILSRNKFNFKNTDFNGAIKFLAKQYNCEVEDIPNKFSLLE